ncbi:MAG: sugar phosphate isomerase/epimerase [Angelakisella sp.]
MNIGISTACYYPLPTEQALAKVVATGVDCTEIFINAFSELQPAILHELKTILAAGNTKVCSLHPFTAGMEPMLFFSDYPRRFDDGCELYKRFFQATAELGGRYLVLHGAITKHPIPVEQYLDSYYRLHTLAKSFGVLLAQENVGRCMSRTPALFTALRKQIPDAAFVLDLKQVFRSDGTLPEFLQAMGANLVHLHLSDGRPDADCLPIGEGSIDFGNLFSTLNRGHYSGDAVLELYSHNYTQEEQLANSVLLLKKMSLSKK